MQRSKNDVWVGLFVLLGAAAVLFLALQSANLLSLNFQSTYKVTAKFDNIGGLKPNAAVKSAGVVIGRVGAITFDDKSFQASIVLDMQSRYAFPKDSSLKILTSGLLGEQYIGCRREKSAQRRCHQGNAIGRGARKPHLAIFVQQSRRYRGGWQWFRGRNQCAGRKKINHAS